MLQQRVATRQQRVAAAFWNSVLQRRSSVLQQRVAACVATRHIVTDAMGQVLDRAQRP
jgi:hypothetical protein